MKALKLGAGEIHTSEDGYLKLIEFYENCNQYQNEEILIDFVDITWIDGNMAALLMAIVQKLNKENSLLFFVDPDVIEKSFHILIRNGWLTGVEFVQRENKTEIKLTGFNKNEDVEFINYIENELLSNQHLKINGPIKGRLIDAFLELYCNVQKHAQTDFPIFACGQFYPDKNRLSFTLVDCGVGYLPPIKEHTNGDIRTSSEAIMWALKGNTTKVGVPGGLGLKEIQRFCDESGSEFVIITGGAFWTNFQLFPTLTKPFCGTIVNVIFDCK